MIITIKRTFLRIFEYLFYSFQFSPLRGLSISVYISLIFTNRSARHDVGGDDGRPHVLLDLHLQLRVHHFHDGHLDSYSSHCLQEEVVDGDRDGAAHRGQTFRSSFGSDFCHLDTSYTVSIVIIYPMV